MLCRFGNFGKFFRAVVDVCGRAPLPRPTLPISSNSRPCHPALFEYPDTNEGRPRWHARCHDQQGPNAQCRRAGGLAVPARIVKDRAVHDVCRSAASPTRFSQTTYTLSRPRWRIDPGRAARAALLSTSPCGISFLRNLKHGKQSAFQHHSSRQPHRHSRRYIRNWLCRGRSCGEVRSRGHHRIEQAGTRCGCTGATTSRHTWRAARLFR